MSGLVMDESLHCRIVVFGDDWGRHPSSSQFLVGGLLPQCETLWVNSVGMRSPTLRLRDLRRIVERLQGIGRATPAAEAATGPTPRIVQPRFLPYHHIGAARSLNQRLIGGQVRARLAELPPAPTVAWVSNPMAAYLLETFDYDYLIYYCGDEFTGMRDVHVPEVIRQEDWLLGQADLCAYASTALSRAKADRQTGDTVLLAHGVQIEKFPATPPAPHPSLADLTHPVLGFFGSFQDWIDVSLVESVAKQRPDWTICLVGVPDERVLQLDALPNIRVCGRVPHHELPQYAANWDAAMLIYDAAHPFTAGISPLKAYEYFALGLPTVSTCPFPDLDGQAFLHVGQDVASYIAAAEAALATTSEQRLQIRQVAERNTWAQRVDLLRATLSRALADRT